MPDGDFLATCEDIRSDAGYAAADLINEAMRARASEAAALDAMSVARGALKTALDVAGDMDITCFVRDALAKLEGK
jgi:hypothetical protein